jgi:hypothetical protein
MQIDATGNPVSGNEIRRFQLQRTWDGSSSCIRGSNPICCSGSRLFHCNATLQKLRFSMPSTVRTLARLRLLIVAFFVVSIGLWAAEMFVLNWMGIGVSSLWLILEFLLRFSLYLAIIGVFRVCGYSMMAASTSKQAIEPSSNEPQ